MSDIEKQEIIKILLKDRTTKKNLIWGTEHYEKKGSGYGRDQEIKEQYLSAIKPRSKKSKREQLIRSKDNAEVFTPTWIINKQNNLVDDAWFEQKGTFNKENQDNSWAKTDKIIFNNSHKWQDYIKSIRLEMCCGEAPYIANIYDSVSGERIPLSERIGILDRKFKVLSENANTYEEWLDYSKTAMKSTYGFEFQGDNLYIARTNLLESYKEYYKNKFDTDAPHELLLEIAEIISWNIWQMDGLKLVVPYSCHVEQELKLDLWGNSENEEQKCPGCENDTLKNHNGIKCVIMDWDTNRKVKYENLL